MSDENSYYWGNKKSLKDQSGALVEVASMSRDNVIPDHGKQ